MVTAFDIARGHFAFRTSVRTMETFSCERIAAVQAIYQSVVADSRPSDLVDIDVESAIGHPLRTSISFNHHEIMLVRHEGKIPLIARQLRDLLRHEKGMAASIKHALEYAPRYQEKLAQRKLEV